MSFEKPDNFQPYTLSPEEAKTMRPLTEEEREELGLGERKKEKELRPEIAGSRLSVTFRNPETGIDQPIEIDLEEILEKQKVFYKKKLNLEINESAIREIWNKNYAEIESEIKKYGYDSVIIVPEDLPEVEDLNKKIIETMDEGGAKGKVAATWQSSNFTDGGSFAGVKNTYSPGYRLVLTHSDQNICENSNANPYLKATLGKNIPMLILNISPKEWNDMKDEEKEKKTLEAFQKLEQGADVDFEAEINGKKIKIQAEGVSLEEYMLHQRMYFEKPPGKHLDEKGWTWLLKSRSGSRVVDSFWDPGDRRLDVGASDPGRSVDILGLRLSRSFSN